MGKRARSQTGRRAGGTGRQAQSGPGWVPRTVAAAVASCPGGTGRAAPHLVATLAAAPATGTGDPGADPVDTELARCLAEATAHAWQVGWQPADLHRAAERTQGRAHARLVARAIAHDAARHRDAAIPSRWRLQLDAIGATGALATVGDRWAVPWPPADAGTAAGPGEGTAPPIARHQAVAVAVEVLALLRSLPRLPKLGPVPGEAPPPGEPAETGAGAGGPAGRGDRARPVGADPRMLHKVTALLAKAESTSFPDEAEALTAKAQQLMTRHAIDRAHLDARQGEHPVVGGRRVGIDDPYGGARYLLLTAVADANRCRAVWTRQWGFATVFGDEGDLDAVEMLFTSLLVQATRAMVAQPRRPGASAGATRSFRQSFLVAFARRIGLRLREAAQQVTAEESERSTALVPVFAQRRAAADAAL
ncbi:MAG: DUF2786 domain-containing protein, partial [Acidimicrobiales bacterium]|nr:DUF2786 domain-containing protein [Acidimicrobiales bacterium]